MAKNISTVIRILMEIATVNPATLAVPNIVLIVRVHSVAAVPDVMETVMAGSHPTANKM